MELRQLRHLLAVIDEGSFTAAADILRISQPGLSLSIRRLENEIGAPLLERRSGNRPVELTEAGRFLVDHVRAPLREIVDAREALRDFSGRPQTTIRLGLVTSTPLDQLNTAMKAIEESGAMVSPVHLAWRGEAAALDERLVDFAFVTTRATKVFKHHRAHLVSTYPLAAAVPTNHALAQRGQVRVHDLLDLPVLDPGPDLPPESDRDRLFERSFWLCDNRLEQRVGDKRGSTAEEMAAFLAGDYGIAIVSASIPQTSVKTVTVPIVDAPRAGVFIIRPMARNADPTDEIWQRTVARLGPTVHRSMP